MKREHSWEGWRKLRTDELCRGSSLQSLLGTRKVCLGLQSLARNLELQTVWSGLRTADLVGF